MLCSLQCCINVLGARRALHPQGHSSSHLLSFCPDHLARGIWVVQAGVVQLVLILLLLLILLLRLLLLLTLLLILLFFHCQNRFYYQDCYY